MKNILKAAPLALFFLLQPAAFPQTGDDFSERMRKAGVNLDDVAYVESTLDNAKPFFSQMWKEMAGTMGMLEPKYQPAYEAIPTGCDRFDTGNAGYCARDNTVYYDPVFIGSVAKEAGRRMNQAPAFAIVATFAHELGHAIGFRIDPVQTYLNSKVPNALDTYNKEAYADCIAGAMSARAVQTRFVKLSTVDAGRMILFLLGDPNSPMADHGTPAERVASFNQGFQNGNGGLQYCKQGGILNLMDAVRKAQQAPGNSAPVAKCSEIEKSSGPMAVLRLESVGACQP
jgi:predicted metalloprotease